MKRLWGRALAGLMALALLLCGCRSMVPERSERLIYATFYPIYALALPILEGAPDLTLKCLVQPQDGCPRAYQLSEWDLALLAQADAAIEGGRGLENFTLSGGNLAVIAAMDNLALLGEGASAGDGEEADHFAGENPWLFLSVEGAGQIAESIAAGMMALDPAYEGLYAENLAAVEAGLDALKAEMRAEVGEPSRKRVALLHEGLGYLADELGLSVVATLRREPGEALYGDELEDFIAALRDSGAQVALVERQAPQTLCRAIEAAGLTIAKIDTLTTGFAADPQAYFQAMRGNARAIAQALA